MEKQCAFDECSNIFEQTAHNKVYCSDECCRLATNKKIMVRYHAKKDRKSGKAFYCEQCGGKLSRYTEGDICAACHNKSILDALSRAKNIARNVQWE